MSTKVTFSMGEARKEGTTRTAFFFYIQPNGEETGLKDCPAFIKDSSIRRPVRRQGIRAGPDIRSNRKVYQLSMPTRIKMFSAETKLGSPRMFYNIYIDIDPVHPFITFTGVGGWGYFSGHAKIDTKESFERDRGFNTTSRMTLRKMKTLLNYQVTGPPAIDIGPVMTAKVTRTKKGVVKIQSSTQRDILI